MLVHGASGGVGLAAVQLCKWKGITVRSTLESHRMPAFILLLVIRRLARPAQHVDGSWSWMLGQRMLLITLSLTTWRRYVCPTSSGGRVSLVLLVDSSLCQLKWRCGCDC